MDDARPELKRGPSWFRHHHLPCLLTCNPSPGLSFYVPGFAADLAPNITKWPLPTTGEAFLPHTDEMSSSPQIALSFLEKALVVSFSNTGSDPLVKYQAQASRGKAECASDMIVAILIYWCPCS